jgi:hypothetical protein
LITQLGELNSEELGVIARTSSMTYKNSEKTLSQITRELGVDYVLETSIRGDLDQYSFSAQLIRTRDHAPIWTRKYDSASSNLIALESDLGRDIAREVGVHTTPEATLRRDRSLSLNPNSHLAYLQGRYYWSQRNKEGLDRGFEYFKRAIEADSKNARAYSGMADSYNMRCEKDCRVMPRFGQQLKSAWGRRLFAERPLLAAYHNQFKFRIAPHAVR